MICLLQLQKWLAKCPHQQVISSFPPRRNVLSAREKASWLWHLVPVFQLGVDLPHQRGDADNGQARDERVALPVCWLRVPAAGW